MVLIRLGPRVWLPIIIVSWGVIATLFAGPQERHRFLHPETPAGGCRGRYSLPEIRIPLHSKAMSVRRRVTCPDQCASAIDDAEACLAKLLS